VHLSQLSAHFEQSELSGFERYEPTGHWSSEHMHMVNITNKIVTLRDIY